MTKAYGKTTKERAFAKGQLVLKIVDHVRRGMIGPSKFLPKWKVHKVHKCLSWGWETMASHGPPTLQQGPEPSG